MANNIVNNKQLTESSPQADQMPSDEYLTISTEGKGVYSEKRSKFLAFAKHVTTVDEAMEVISDYRKKYYDARHCCYAYMLGSDRDVFRSNDDGEPSSTAGRPILGQINSNQLTDILIIVVRYYGGINLGTSGLIAAYRTAAALAIADSQIVPMIVEKTLTYTFTYPMLNDVMRVIKEMSAKIVDQQFDNTCSITLAIRKNDFQILSDRLNKLAYE